MGEEHLDRGGDVGTEEVTTSRPASPPTDREIGEEEVRLQEESEDFVITMVGEVRSPHEEGEGD